MQYFIRNTLGEYSLVLYECLAPSVYVCVCDVTHLETFGSSRNNYQSSILFGGSLDSRISSLLMEFISMAFGGNVQIK